MHIVGDFGQGGIQTYVRDLLAQHSRHPDIESIVLLLYSKGALFESVTDLGVNIYFIGMKGAGDLFGLTRAIKKAMGLKPDITHVHAVHPLIGPLLRIASMPAIYHEHGGILERDGVIKGGNPLSRLLCRNTYKSYKKYLAISDFVKESMDSTISGITDRIVTIYNGADIDGIDVVPPVSRTVLPAGWREDSIAVGIAGRLAPQKDIDKFLEVAAELSKHYSNIVFPIVGDGPLREELEDKAYSLGLAESVLFLGYRKDAIAIMKRFDVFLFTSAWEAFGLVVIEAMAAGVPVVAVHTPDSAVDEIIEFGVNGYVLGNSDPARISECVIRLLEDKALRQDIVKSARGQVHKRFSMAITAERIYQVYIDVVDKSKCKI
ncbi:hypothetical protein MNBD_BACTEROID07-346 [hydrothermal vent metagenome]|uniref:Glycosyltransferase n=1 Tax=hydrothermal vent metagenome TaxID=652676 RepID=A0A3B0UJ97_9ZZZZ